MLRLSRKVGQAIQLIDPNGRTVGEVRVMPQRRSGQIALGIHLIQGYSVRREEVGLSRLERVKLKLKTLMYKNGRDDIAELDFPEVIDAVINDKSLHWMTSDLINLDQEHEKAKHENNT